MNEEKKKNFVSIIIPTFNRSEYLYSCLFSISNQTYNNKEIIVLDDGSNKKNAEKNKNICNQFNCNYYYLDNNGSSAARNYGIKKAKGDFIAFCDDDDFWSLDKLEKQVDILDKFSEFGLVTGNIEYVLNEGTKTGNIKSHKGYNHGFIFNELLMKNRTDMITPLLRKEVFDKVGCFNTNYIIAEDWEFWRRVSYYYKFYFVDEVLGYVRSHDNNISRTRAGTVLERYKLYKKLTNSLLNWGKGRFSKKEINHIKYIEWCFYRRLFSNNLGSMKKKIQFLIFIWYDFPKLLKLYFYFNKDYKIPNN